MQITSYQHPHKIGLTVFLLALFAIPFILEWQNLNQHDTSTFMAGGAVVGRPAVHTSRDSSSATNNSGAMAAVAGKTLIGALAEQ
ncbi:MAG TPA: hypothetical protein VN031_00630 [Candidatus Microsaccharimonas sp.]|nr:hypothetical protein [Candidatus Microsaccharimonas sp.]